MANYKILATRWCTPSDGVIGYVAIESSIGSTRVWKCYIGCMTHCEVINERADAFRIASHGAKVDKDIACAVFKESDLGGLTHDDFTY